jgi:hypothetical protein
MLFFILPALLIVRGLWLAYKQSTLWDFIVYMAKLAWGGLAIGLLCFVLSPYVYKGPLSWGVIIAFGWLFWKLIRYIFSMEMKDSFSAMEREQGQSWSALTSVAWESYDDEWEKEYFGIAWGVNLAGRPAGGTSDD